MLVFWETESSACNFQQVHHKFSIEDKWYHFIQFYNLIYAVLVLFFFTTSDMWWIIKIPSDVMLASFMFLSSLVNLHAVTSSEIFLFGINWRFYNSLVIDCFIELSTLVIQPKALDTNDLVIEMHIWEHDWGICLIMCAYIHKIKHIYACLGLRIWLQGSMSEEEIRTFLYWTWNKEIGMSPFFCTLSTYYNNQTEAYAVQIYMHNFFLSRVCTM